MVSTSEPAPAATQTQEPPKKRTFPKRLPFDREAIKLASIGGLEDPDIASQYPGLAPNTIRKWRQRDDAWSAAYYATRQGKHRGNPPAVVRKAREAYAASDQAPQLQTPKTSTSLASTATNPGNLSPLVTHDILTEGIPTLANRNRLRMAYEVDRALAARRKSKKPLPINTLADLNQAGRALLLAEGRDAEAPAIQLNVWGSPGLQAQQDTGGFRDLPAETATQPQPDGP